MSSQWYAPVSVMLVGICHIVPSVDIQLVQATIIVAHRDH